MIERIYEYICVVIVFIYIFVFIEVPHTVIRLPGYFESLLRIPFVFRKKDDGEHIFGRFFFNWVHNTLLYFFIKPLQNYIGSAAYQGHQLKLNWYFKVMSYL